MTPRVIRIIKEKGDAIQCASEMGEADGHAGVILIAEEGKKPEILGRTDPTFDSAEDAVASMEKAVATIIGSKPAGKAGETKKEKKSSKKKGVYRG